MTGDTMKPFNTVIPDPSDHIGTTMLTQEYHLEPPVTGYRIFTIDGTYFQLIKQYYERDKHFVSTMHYCHGSYPTDIRTWHQLVATHSSTHGIYVHPY